MAKLNLVKAQKLIDEDNAGEDENLSDAQWYMETSFWEEMEEKRQEEERISNWEEARNDYEDYYDYAGSEYFP